MICGVGNWSINVDLLIQLLANIKIPCIFADQYRGVEQ